MALVASMSQFCTEETCQEARNILCEASDHRGVRLEVFFTVLEFQHFQAHTWPERLLRSPVRNPKGLLATILVCFQE